MIANTVPIHVNGTAHTVREGATIAELLDELGLCGRPLAVELNRAVVPRTEHPARRLVAGDRLEIVTLVGGG